MRQKQSSRERTTTTRSAIESAQEMLAQSAGELALVLERGRGLRRPQLVEMLERIDRARALVAQIAGE